MDGIMSHDFPMGAIHARASIAILFKGRNHGIHNLRRPSELLPHQHMHRVENYETRN